MSTNHYTLHYTTFKVKSWLLAKIKSMTHSIFPFLFPEQRKIWPLDGSNGSGKYSIYGLMDPINAEIFYIGLSKNVHRRYNRHLSKALDASHSNEKVASRIRQLVSKDKIHPFLIIFYTGLSSDQASEIEIMTIARYKRGHKLLNITKGGELGFNPNPKKKQRKWLKVF